MDIINITQTLASNFRRKTAFGERNSKVERRSSERRIHADRRKEPRFGDMVERRQQIDRRSI